ncbi:MAG: hypothetical protein AB7S78_01335 [Candidatus Omnitrophota bacterium]
MTKNTDRDPTLCRTFIAFLKKTLSKHPDITHTWSIDEDEDHCILEIFKQTETGFDIIVEVFPNKIHVNVESSFFDFTNFKSVEDMVQTAWNLIRDLLSPAMRLVEFLSDGKPYKWKVEFYNNGKWKSKSCSSLLFFKYFGKKTKTILQNKVINIPLDKTI